MLRKDRTQTHGSKVKNRGILGLVDNVFRIRSVYGYYMGGNTGTEGSTYSVITDRINFASGVMAANSVSNLTVARGGNPGLSDTKIYGYTAGGYITANTATAQRITFNTGVTAANTVSNLSQARRSLGSMSDGKSYGCFYGGYTFSGVTTTDIVNFNTSISAANTASNMVTAQNGFPQGLSDGKCYGYTSQFTASDRMTFATRIFNTNTTSKRTNANFYGEGTVSDGKCYGYFMGTAYQANTTTDRILFSTGVTSANTVSNLTAYRFYQHAISDGALYGYHCGGRTSNSTQNMGVAGDRISFNTGVTAANTVSNLSVVRGMCAALSDFNV